MVWLGRGRLVPIPCSRMATEAMDTQPSEILCELLGPSASATLTATVYAARTFCHCDPHSHCVCCWDLPSVGPSASMTLTTTV